MLRTREVTKGLLRRAVEQFQREKRELQDARESELTKLTPIEDSAQQVPGFEEVSLDEIVELLRRNQQLQERHKLQDEIRKNLQSLDQRIEKLGAVELTVEDQAVTLANFLLEFEISEHKFFDLISLREIRELLFQNQLTLSTLFSTLMAQLERAKQEPVYQDYLDFKKKLYQAAVSGDPVSDLVLEKAEKLAAAANASAFENLFKKDNLAQMQSKVEELSRRFGPIPRNFMEQALPELDFSIDLEEIKNIFQGNYPSYGISEAELVKIFAYPPVEGIKAPVPREIIQQFIEALPENNEGRNIKRAAIIKASGKEEKYRTVLITFEGFLLLLNMMIKGSLKASKEGEPLHTIPHSGRIVWGGNEGINAGVSLFTLQKIVDRHKVQPPYEVIQTYESGLNLGKRSTGEWEAKPNARSISFSALKTVFPNFSRILGIDKNIAVSQFFDYLSVRYEFKKGSSEDYFYHNKSFWLTENGFQKLFALMRSLTEEQFVDGQMQEYFGVAHDPAALFECVLQEYQREIYVDNAPYAIWAEILRFSEKVNLPGVLALKHSSVESTIESVILPELRDEANPVTRNRARAYINNRKSLLIEKLISYRQGRAVDAFTAFAAEVKAQIVRQPNNTLEDLYLVLNSWIEKLSTDEALASMSLADVREMYLETRFLRWHAFSQQNLHELLGVQPGNEWNEVYPALKASKLVEGQDYKVEYVEFGKNLLISHQLRSSMKKVLSEMEADTVSDLVPFLNQVAELVRNSTAEKEKRNPVEDSSKLRIDVSQPVVEDYETVSPESIMDALDNPSIDKAEIVALYFRDALEYAQKIFLRFEAIVNDLPLRRGNTRELQDLFKRELVDNQRKNISRYEAGKRLYKFSKSKIEEILEYLSAGTDVTQLPVSALLNIMQLDLEEVPHFEELFVPYSMDLRGDAESLVNLVNTRLSPETKAWFLSLTLEDVIHDPSILVRVVAEILRVEFPLERSDYETSSVPLSAEEEGRDIPAVLVDSYDESDPLTFILSHMAWVHIAIKNVFLSKECFQTLGREQYLKILQSAHLTEIFYDQSVKDSIHVGEMPNSYRLIARIYQSAQSQEGLQEILGYQLYEQKESYIKILAVLLWEGSALQSILKSYLSPESEEEEAGQVWSKELMGATLEEYAKQSGANLAPLDLDSIFDHILSLQAQYSHFPRIESVLMRLARFRTEIHGRSFSNDTKTSMTFKPNDLDFRIVLIRQDGLNREGKNKEYWSAVASSTTEHLSSTNPAGNRVRSHGKKN